MVYRLDVANASSTPPAVGTVGAEGFPTSGVPGVTPPALIDPYWAYSLCEEIRNVAVAGGQTPTKSKTNQLLLGIQTLLANSSSVMIGEIKPWVSSVLPAKYLWANGQAISRTTYSALFTFSTGQATFGPGDGSTTFNVPDMCGRVFAGADNMGGITSKGRLTAASLGVAAALGATGGDEHMQQHNHTLGPGESVWVSGSSNYNTGSTSSAQIGGGTIQNSGTGTAQNVQPTFVGNWIIYAGV